MNAYTTGKRYEDGVLGCGWNTSRPDNMQTLDMRLEGNDILTLNRETRRPTKSPPYKPPTAGAKPRYRKTSDLTSERYEN
jgi:hypothetical protein